MAERYQLWSYTYLPTIYKRIAAILVAGRVNLLGWQGSLSRVFLLLLSDGYLDMAMCPCRCGAGNAL